MNIIRFAVHHPVAVCMFMILLTMGGVFAISAMEEELLPSISIPTLVVFTSNPKASPEEIHKDITLPMEEALNSTAGLVSMNSVSLEGESRIILELDWGRNVDLAEVELRERMNTVKLPDTAKKPLVWKFDPSSSPVFRFDIFGRDGRNVPAEELRRLAKDLIKPRIERIAGVGEVAILGGAEPEYRVAGRPADLARYNLTVPALVKCIQDEARNRKGGSLAIEGGREATVRFSGKAADADDLKSLIVAVLPGGKTVRVRDVADVARAMKKEESFARYDGCPSVGISIKKTSDASVVSVIDAIKAELGELSGREALAQVQMRVSQDDSEYVVNARNMVLSSLVQGVLLAALLLVLFLRNLRTTVVVALATPISLVAAFMCLKGLGLSRNVLTLGGMGLAAGMTLDSSIVLLDSIMKQMELGKPPREAAIGGASEVSLGIFSSNMTTVAVFLPILFIPGLMREIFKDLSYSIIFAILFAMVIGVLFIPMVSARILTATSPKAGPAPTPAAGWRKLLLYPWNLMCRVMEKFDAASEAALAAIIKFFLRSFAFKAATVAALVAVSALSLAFVPGRAFLPQGEVNELWIRFEPPVGSTLDYVDARVARIETLLKTEPYVSFVEYAAANVEEREGRIFAKLYPNKQLQQRDERGVIQTDAEGKPLWQRQRLGEWRSLARCVQKIRDGCDGIPDLQGNTFVTVVDKVRGGDAAPVTFKIFRRRAGGGAEREELHELQDYAKAELLPELQKVESGCYQRVKINETPKEIVIDAGARRERLHETGISTQCISDTVRASVYGVEAGSVQEADRDVDIVAMLGDGSGTAARYPVFGVGEIKPLKVRSPVTGALSAVEDIAAVSQAPAAGATVLERTNRKPTATLESNCMPYELTGRTVGDLSREAQARLRALPGFAENYDYELKNTAKDTEESFADAGKAFVISIILVYMIMCAQFERLGDPLSIMITVPLAAVGSVVLLRLTGEVTSLGALVGAVILCGVVVNNGIILVEYINILRERGVPRDEAIVAGSVRKLRSILITSLTSILGMLPMVLGVGEGTELYRGVAAVIVGGLLVSTPLTLVALPLMYSLVGEIGEFAAAATFRLSVLLGQRKRGKS